MNDSKFHYLLTLLGVNFFGDYYVHNRLLEAKIYKVFTITSGGNPCWVPLWEGKRKRRNNFVKKKGLIQGAIKMVCNSIHYIIWIR